MLQKDARSSTINNNGAQILSGDVQIYFSGESHALVATDHGLLTARESSRGFGNNAYSRSVEDSCDWAMLAALHDLQAQARAVGANAVINVRSNWYPTEPVTGDKYDCEKSQFVAEVALKGQAVTLESTAYYVPVK